MSHRIRAIVGCLALAFALSATPVARAQGEPMTATRPAENFDARPFGREFGGTSATGFATSRPATSSSSTSITSTLPSLGFDIGRMLAALLIVLALIGLAYWAARRLTGRNSGVASTRAVKILSRTLLAPRQQVVLLQVGRRVIVVGESAGQLSSLAQIDDADEVAHLLGQIEGERMRKSASFGGAFRKSQTSFDEPPEPSPERERSVEEATPEIGDLDRQRSELSGLLDKVRALRGQIDK